MVVERTRIQRLPIETQEQAINQSGATMGQAQRKQLQEKKREEQMGRSAMGMQQT